MKWLQEVTDVFDCAAQVGPLSPNSVCEGRVSCVWLGLCYCVRLHMLDSQELTIDS